MDFHRRPLYPSTRNISFRISQETVSFSLSCDTNRLRRRFANGGQRSSTFVSTTIASWGTARRAATLEAEGIESEETSLFATEVGAIFRASFFNG